MKKFTLILSILFVLAVIFYVFLGGRIPKSHVPSNKTNSRYLLTIENLTFCRNKINSTSKDKMADLVRKLQDYAKNGELCEYLTEDINVIKQNCRIQWKTEDDKMKDIGGFLIDAKTFEVKLNLPVYPQEKSKLKNRPEISLQKEEIYNTPENVWEQNPLNW